MHMSEDDCDRADNAADLAKDRRLEEAVWLDRQHGLRRDWRREGRTLCCGAMSTYLDDFDGNPELCCKSCCRRVPIGEGDGNRSQV